MPAAIVLGTSTFTMSALPGTPSIQNAIPMPFLVPRLWLHRAWVLLPHHHDGFGMWWLGRAEAGPAVQVWGEGSLRRRMKGSRRCTGA